MLNHAYICSKLLSKQKKEKIVEDLNGFSVSDVAQAQAPDNAIF